MKKMNLLSKAEMKNVKGGQNLLLCTYYVVCTASPDDSIDIHYFNHAVQPWVKLKPIAVD